MLWPARQEAEDVAQYLCTDTDATGVLVQQKERCRTGHWWREQSKPLTKDV
jgi:hypothetical protein